MFWPYYIMKIFTLEDYNQIIFDGFSYQLPVDVFAVITALSKEVESFAPASASVSEDKTKRGFQSTNNKKPRVRRNDSNEDWNAIRSFKSTVIEKKEGTEKTLNDIRACLNKISSKNYDSQKEQIIVLIKEIAQQCEDASQVQSVSASIYDIASNNKFNSVVYANLYKELVSQFNELGEPFEEFVALYSDSITKIGYADPNEDYDRYCEYIKLNDRRKSISTFLSNLLKIGFVNKERIIDIILNSQNLINEFVDSENKTNDVDEITENVSIFITLLRDDLRDEPGWTKITENIIKCSQLKAKEKKSLSSRTVFKYMDIVKTVTT